MGEAVPILMYHSVDRVDVDRWMLSADLFAQHMQWLADHGYRSMTVSAFVKARRNSAATNPKTVIITFDDGLRDFLTEAVPIMQRHGFVATLYVVTGLVGGTCPWSLTSDGTERPMLSWAEVRALPELGMECGGHTHTHPQLDVISSDEAFAEIMRSKSELEDHLGRGVESFAYPHGYASRETRRLVRQAGFTSACRVRHALSSTREDPFALSRVIMTNEISVDQLEGLMTGHALPVAPPPDRAIGAGWRLVRKIGSKLSRPRSRATGGPAGTGPRRASSARS